METKLDKQIVLLERYYRLWPTLKPEMQSDAFHDAMRILRELKSYAEISEHALEELNGFATHDDNCDLNHITGVPVQCSCGYLKASTAYGKAVLKLSEINRAEKI
jgi:hypothetical protein